MLIIVILILIRDARVKPSEVQIPSVWTGSTANFQTKSLEFWSLSQTNS